MVLFSSRGDILPVLPRKFYFPIVIFQSKKVVDDFKTPVQLHTKLLW